MKNYTKAITEFGVMLAVLFVAMTLDRALSIWTIVSFAIVSVATTASFAMIKNKPTFALASGFFFGVASLVTAFMFSRTTFYNPLVSILPRVLVGITGFGVYKLVELILGRVKNKHAVEYIALTIGSAVLALSNTVLTLTCMWMFAQYDPLFVAFNAMFLTNVLPEMLIAAIVSPPVILGVRRGLRLGEDGKPRIRQRNNESVPSTENAEKLTKGR